MSINPTLVIFLVAILIQWSRVSLSKSTGTDGDRYRKALMDKANNLGRCYTNESALVLPNMGTCKSENYQAGYTEDQLEWINSFSPAIPKRTYPIVVRKDIRLFTDEERETFLSVFRNMDALYTIGNMSEYNAFIKMHNYGISVAPQPPTKSINAGFFSWHRMASFFLEEVLQSHQETIAMPTWDVLLDAYLPEIRDSIIWSEDFMGNCGSSGLKWDDIDSSANGPVIIKTGKFAYWEKFQECYNVDVALGGTDKYNWRTCKKSTKYDTDKTFCDYDINLLLNYTTMEELASTACLGDDHFVLHMYLTAPEYMTSTVEGCGTVADPSIWLLHTWTDYIFALFRQVSQVTDLETEYPIDNSTAFCYMPDYRLTPFPIKLIEGYSRDFTSYHYVYEQTPTVCSSDEECGNTKWLWCDVALSRCKSKIISGGNCFGHPDKACASGSCQNNRCA